MTTYEITNPAAAERYFDQSFVGDAAAFIVTLAAKFRQLARVVSHSTHLAHQAEARR